MSKGYIRAASFSVEEILPQICDRSNLDSSRQFNCMIEGQPVILTVKMTSQRYILFKQKGTVCSRCGIKGRYFILERSPGNNPNKFHFNLYGKTDTGKEVMITKDHIMPKSAGGENRLENYQVMCSVCNSKKGSKIPND